MMKVDVLSDLGEIKVCESYIYKGEKTMEFPVNFNDQWDVNYKSFQSWSDHSFKEYREFPDELSTYISFIEMTSDIPVNMVSVGPDRKETILR
jgi:adenylosuccinate synthase